MENRRNVLERANVPKPLRRTAPDCLRRITLVPAFENFAEPKDDERRLDLVSRFGQET
jgi:hypothetical protein